MFLKFDYSHPQPYDKGRVIIKTNVGVECPKGQIWSEVLMGVFADTCL